MDQSPTTTSTTQATQSRFDPSKYLVDLSGRGSYLEVKWRLLWFRAEHPEGHIHTELIRLEDNVAVFRAEAWWEGGGRATGYGSESAGDFRDYLEKAETKAIGRALAALGYGTQFAPEYDVPGIADVYERGRATQQDVRAGRPAPGKDTTGKGVGAGRKDVTPTGLLPATPNQLSTIEALGAELYLDDVILNEWAKEKWSVDEWRSLNRRDASYYIDFLRNRRVGRG